MRAGRAGEPVVARAVRVLDAFGPEEPALRVSEIAERAGLHVATASRLVAQLTAEGLLARDRDRRVRIGVRFWELAMRASPTRSLREAALPSMEALHGIVRHHVQLGVLDGDDVLCLERLSAPDAVVSFSQVAGRLPTCASSCGIVLLAHAPRACQDRVLSGPLVPYTARTMTEPVAVRAALDRARRDGYAALVGHLHEASGGIAVPVRSPAGRVVAALGVIVPPDAEPQLVVPLLQLAARSIGAGLASAS